MPRTPTYPGVYIDETPSGTHMILGVPTSITAFVGRTERGPIDTPVALNSFGMFERTFGGLWSGSPLPHAVRDFFQNGGTDAIIVRVYPGAREHTARIDANGLVLVASGDPALGSPDELIGDRERKTGLYALEDADLLNLMCIPPDARDATTAPAIYDAALTYCVERRAMLIVDPPATWASSRDAIRGIGGTPDAGASSDGPPSAVLSLGDSTARNAALYFPRVKSHDPLDENRPGTFVPCGMVAGVMARTDRTRGVWKAPAGTDAALFGASGLSVDLNDGENGELNRRGINCLREFPMFGPVVWGARTLRGADALGDEYKYVPVRRLALFIEESVLRGTAWVVFEPNDEPLWAQVRTSVGAFMQELFRDGAFAGATPRDAFFVKCDAETITEDDRERGIVNIMVGFAPMKPAEFVVIRVVQRGGEGDG